jgi:hypothetical protein
MIKYTADVTVQITVTFDDDGESSLLDQAIDAVWDHDLSRHTDDVEVHQNTIKAVGKGGNP